MPITPFHFGPGFFIKSILLKRFSFRVFILANILIDVEPLYYILTNQYPLHRFFHTYIGATVVAIVSILLGGFIWRKIPKSAVIAGSFLGTYSHVLLDSIMHADLRPFYPVTNVNSLLHVLNYFQLHLLCVTAGVLGGFLYILRQRKINKE